jgi:hypothetical protein
MILRKRPAKKIILAAMSNDPSRQEPQEEGKPQGTKGGEEKTPIKDTKQALSQDTRGEDRKQRDPRKHQRRTTRDKPKPNKEWPPCTEHGESHVAVALGAYHCSDDPEGGGLGRRKCWTLRSTEKLVNESHAFEGCFPPDIQRVGLSRVLRSSIIEKYPALDHHNGHRAFAGYLLLGSFREKDQPILKAEYVEKCYGIPEGSSESGRVNIEHILIKFRNEVFGSFRWSGYKPGERCRIALDIGIEPDLLHRVEKELRTNPRTLEDRVSWMEGRKIDGKYISNIRSKAIKCVQEGDAPHGPSSRWVQYMNGLPPDLFSWDVGNFDRAWEMAESWFPDIEKDELSDKEIERKSRRQQAEAHLRRIQTQPQPIYDYSNFTTRVTAPNSLQTIDGDLREIMTGNWVEYDLSSAQLAIASVDWGLDEIREFLENGGDIWRLIAERTGFPKSKYKPVFKKGLYSAVYGASRQNIVEEYMKEKADEEAIEYSEQIGETILSADVFSLLFEQREQVFHEVLEDGGATDCFGNPLSIREIQDKEGKESEYAAACTVLSCLNQAQEMDLLTPALNLAEEAEEYERPPFRIALYQYDGFSVKYYTDSRRHHHERIVEGVNEKCDRLGYPTRLETETDISF